MNFWRKRGMSKQEEGLGITTFDPHAQQHVSVTMMPGCCSVGIIWGLYNLTLESLADAEERAKKCEYSVMFATVSTHQKDAGVADILHNAGWTVINIHRSKPYGGGFVYLYMKDLPTQAGIEVDA